MIVKSHICILQLHVYHQWMQWLCNESVTTIYCSDCFQRTKSILTHCFEYAGLLSVVRIFHHNRKGFSRSGGKDNQRTFWKIAVSKSVLFNKHLIKSLWYFRRWFLEIVKVGDLNNKSFIKWFGLLDKYGSVFFV